jgi:hypothetical protein
VIGYSFKAQRFMLDSQKILEGTAAGPLSGDRLKDTPTHPPHEQRDNSMLCCFIPPPDLP